MKLDKNVNPDGKGKYALIKLRDCAIFGTTVHNGVPCFVVPQSAIDFGNSDDSEFFVIRIKDKYAHIALNAYADAATLDSETEWGQEVRKLAVKAMNHPHSRKPD